MYIHRITGVQKSAGSAVVDYYSGVSTSRCPMPQAMFHGLHEYVLVVLRPLQ